jgi:DNA mismatch repair ATPase MutS
MRTNCSRPLTTCLLTGSGRLTDIYQFTNTKVQEIFQVCQQQVCGLYKAAEAVSMLDLLLSFATTLTLGHDKKYTRPQVASTAQNTLAIQQGRHPILETISAGAIVPNDTFHNDKQNVAMISGANMAGKSTYIKQVALCVILAHVGAHVPAEFFASPPIDRIFTRYA